MNYQKYMSTINEDDSTRYILWEEHRNHTMKYIDEACKGISNPSVLVIGSGNCDDIELELLSNKCQYIRLVDIDTESTERAIKRRIPTATNIEVVNLNILNIEDSIFEDMATAIRSKDKDAILNKANQVVQMIPSSFVTLTPDMHFDVVVILPIFSQLTTYFYNVLQKAEIPGDLYKTVDRKILPQLANYWSKLALNNAQTYLKQDGKLVFISDMVDMYESVCKPFLSDLKSGNLDTMETAINQVHIARGGYSAGVDGLISWLKSKSDLTVEYWIWKFGKNKEYFVIGGIIKNI